MAESQGRAHLAQTNDSLEKVNRALSDGSSSLADLQKIVATFGREESEADGYRRKELQNVLDNLADNLRSLQERSAETPSSVSSLGLPSYFFAQPASTSGTSKTENDDHQRKLHSSYEELLSQYGVHERYREYCTSAWNTLSHYTFRRSALRMDVSPRSSTSRATFMDENMHRFIEKYILNMGSSLPALSCMAYGLTGSVTVVEVVIDRIFRAVILLRGSLVEAANFRGSEEPFNLDAKAMRPMNLWTPSMYEVYRICTTNANAAALYYYNPANPEMTLKSYLGTLNRDGMLKSLCGLGCLTSGLCSEDKKKTPKYRGLSSIRSRGFVLSKHLLWLNSFTTLFSSPCRKCGRYLSGGLPPTFRDYKKFEPYHETCRNAYAVPE